MTPSTTASASGKTPFAAIKETEEAAQKRIDEEQRKLAEELENAKERNGKYEEDKKREIGNKAREELKQEKASMGSIIAESDSEAEQECAELEKKAQARMPDVLKKLKEEFFSLPL